MNPNKIAIIGSGFSGSVIAHLLAQAGYAIEVFEARTHIGGNCFTQRDSKTRILVHQYGPHIFHTDDQEVWEFMCRFTKMMPFVNRVKANVGNQIYSLPVNLHTINQFFKQAFSPDEAKQFIQKNSLRFDHPPENFEEQALSFIGSELYEAFFKGYTQKQWGLHPSKLPASILKRLPLRFNYNDNYFNHRYQGMPENGYTPIFDQLLDHPKITVHLNQTFLSEQKDDYQQVFYSGPIDQWFNHRFGELKYRTLDFETHYGKNDFQGCAVLNYCDEKIPYTRITEHKHFSPWEEHEDTVYFKEFSREGTLDDIPYYPVRLSHDNRLFDKYWTLAEQEDNVTFVGRLGTYRYLDMDVTIREAIDVAQAFLQTH